MSRVVSWCMFPLLCLLAACGDEPGSNTRAEDDRIRLLKTLQSELAARAAELKPKVAEEKRLLEVAEEALREATERGASEEERRSIPARVPYFETACEVEDLRHEINDLQLKIQRIEGFWETDPDIKALDDPSQRDEALWRLLVRNPDLREDDPKEEASCRVNHVVPCPQRNGPPMVAVFKAANFDEGDLRGRAIGHIILFMSTGSHVPYFEGSNVIEPTGVVRDLNADGIIDIADAFSCSGGGGDDFYHFYVLPVTPVLTAALQVWWRESYDAEDEEILWGFEAIDPDGDGVHDIVIGPRADKGGIEEKARYVWSATEGGWTGPPGSTTGHFYRFDPDQDEDLQVEAFANKRVLKPEGR